MAARIKKGDKVVVLAGKDKGKTGDVVRVLPADNRVIVRGINISRRHQRQTPSQQAGIVAKEMPVDLSNVAVADPSDGKPTKVGFRFNKDGAKERFSRRTGELIDG
ncbi:50S ribosomal protein L24 [Bauldia sp.]|uniref:50S ribosomal protein L24 n=1 Tax=Bauldia sp. TaxID=2575872 RepID=UPI003BAA7189